MTGRIVEISCASGHRDSIVSSTEQFHARVLSEIESGDDPVRVDIRVLVSAETAQAFLDCIQKQLPPEASPIILVQSIDAQLPAAQLDEEREDARSGVRTTREELYTEVEKGTTCDSNFLILVVLATLVATIGLSEDNVAVVIAAMVIAPLLGPNLGLALGAALGDKDLIKRALVTNFVGVSLTIGLAALIALLMPPNLDSNEIMSRTEVRASTIILALASGIAAVQSMTTRLASVLVGVMVAVALVPPATVFGLMLGAGHWSLAGGAGGVLAVNVVSVNLAAQLVLAVRGIRPRSWLERKAAAQSTLINTIVWVLLLLLGIAIVAVSSR